MIQRRIFEEVGRFNADYFMYADDVDLCFKVQKAGYRNYYVSDAVVIHHGGGSSQNSGNHFASVMMVTSMEKFLRTYRGSLYSGVYRVVTGAMAFLRILTLIAFGPVYWMRSKIGQWRGSVGKWAAIFRWSLGISRGQMPKSKTHRLQLPEVVS